MTAPCSPWRRLKQLLRHVVDDDAHAAARRCECTAAAKAGAHLDDAVAAFHRMPLFDPSWEFTPDMKAQMDKDGHVVLPGLMTAEAVEIATAACARVQAIHEEFTARLTPLRRAHEARVAAATSDAERDALEEERWAPGADGDFNLVLNPGSNCAEIDPFFEAALGHPDMRQIVEGVLGEDWRFDHCTMVSCCRLCDRRHWRG